jgi:hypothetical protein
MPTTPEQSRDPAVRTTGSEAPRAPRRIRRRVEFWWQFAFQTRAGKPRGFLRFWPFWERIVLHFRPIVPIPGAPTGVLLIRVDRFRGRPIELPDGTHVRRGDRIIEVHLNNRTITRVASVGPFGLLRMMAEDLRALAAWVEEPIAPADIRALYAVTLLSRAGPRLGFTLRERPVNLHNWLERFFMQGLLVLYNLQGVQRLLQGSTYGGYPQEIWMSRGELTRRYGRRPSASARGA